MAEDKPQEAAGKNIGMAVICYIWILVLIPLLTDAKNDPFVKFHIKQGLVLLIASIILGVVGGAIPFLGWFIIAPIGSLVMLVLAIMGIVNAAGGKEAQLPLIGKWGDKFNI